MRSLPLLLDQCLCIVTMERGAVTGMRLPNWYCSAPACGRALFAVAACVHFGDRTVPRCVRGPVLPELECLAVALTAARLWPGSPVAFQVAFQYEVLDWMSSVQLQCVARCACRAVVVVNVCRPDCVHSAPEFSTMAWMEAINDASERHGVLRKLPRSVYTQAFRAYKHTFMRSKEFVTLVERPKQEILCCCCAGAGLHALGDACFKATRCLQSLFSLVFVVSLAQARTLGATPSSFCQL